jgi:Domain of unknown function (DUF4118)/LytTr DNA-binding domain
MMKALRYEFRSALPGYGVAGVSTALATLAQFPLRPLVGSQHPYSFFYVAVMVTAWYAGLRRALLALALGALSANYFFLPPENTLAIAGTANQVGLALYLLVALVGTLLIEALRQPAPAVERLPPLASLDTRAGFLGRAPAPWSPAEGTEQRAAREPQEARALAQQLMTARDELARAQEEVRRQREAIDQLVLVLQCAPNPEASPAEPLSRLPIPGGDSVVLLRATEIDYVECRGGPVVVRAGRDEYPTPYTLAEVEGLLPAEHFFRVHAEYLVNLERVLDLVFPDGESHEIRLSDGQRLPVERGRGPELRRRLGLEDSHWG